MSNTDEVNPIYDIHGIWENFRNFVGDKPLELNKEQEIAFKNIFYWNIEKNKETSQLPILEYLSNDLLFWRCAIILAIQDTFNWYEQVLEQLFQNAPAEAMKDISLNVVNWNLGAFRFKEKDLFNKATHSLIKAENIKDVAKAIIALDDGDIDEYLKLTERFAIGNKNRVISVIFDIYYAILEKYDPNRAAKQMAAKYQLAPDYYYMRFRQTYYELKTLTSETYCQALRSSFEYFDSKEIGFFLERWQELYSISPDFMATVQLEWRNTTDKKSKKWTGYHEFLSAIVEDPGNSFELNDLMNATEWLDSNELHEELKFFAQDSDNRLYGSLCRFAQIRALRLIKQNLDKNFESVSKIFQVQNVNWCPIHESTSTDLVSFIRTFILKDGGKSGQIKLNRLGLQAIQQLGRESKVFELDSKSKNFLTRNGKFPLLEWQEAALKSWAAHGRQGLVAAATGTGKSRLGTAAILEAYNDGLPIVLLTHRLAIKGQWKKDELGAINSVDIHGYELPKDLKIFSLGDNVRELSCEDHYNEAAPPFALPNRVLIALDKSLANRNHLLPGDRTPGLLVADEVHQYNDPTGKVILEGNFSRRIGLSATISGFDDYGLLGYFGGSKVVDYPIYKATRDKVISAYNLLTIRTNYQPVQGFGGSSQFVELSSGKRDSVTWQQLDKANEILQSKYMMLLNHQDFEYDSKQDFESQIEDLVLRKVPVLAELAKGYLKEKKNYENILRRFQIDSDPLELLAQKIATIGRTLIFSNSKVQGKYYRDTLTKRGVKVGYIDSDTEQIDRGSLFNELQRNEIKALISPQILDEGVNLPNAQIGLFLGNGTNVGSSYRQTIQRMGRVLRKKSENEKALLVLVVGKHTREDPGSDGKNKYLDNQFAIMGKHAANRDSLPVVDFENSSQIYRFLDEYVG